jgi:hypothetical protein
MTRIFHLVVSTYSGQILRTILSGLALSGFLTSFSASRSVEIGWVDVTEKVHQQSASSISRGSRIYAKRAAAAETQISIVDGRPYSQGSLSFVDEQASLVRSTDYQFYCATAEFTKKDGRQDWDGKGYYITPATSRSGLDWFAYTYFCDLNAFPWPWQALDESVRGMPLYLNRPSVKTFNTSSIGPLRFAVFVSVSPSKQDQGSDDNYESYIFAMSCSRGTITSDVPDGGFDPSRLRLVKPYPDSFGSYVLKLICDLG